MFGRHKGEEGEEEEREEREERGCINSQITG